MNAELQIGRGRLYFVTSPSYIKKSNVPLKKKKFLSTLLLNGQLKFVHRKEEKWQRDLQPMRSGDRHGSFSYSTKVL